MSEPHATLLEPIAPDLSSPDLSSPDLSSPDMSKPGVSRPDLSHSGLIKILIAPHASLRAKARPVSPADADVVRALAPRMLAAMYAAPGIGLAAPQVDTLLRLIVVDLAPPGKPAPVVLVNPEIVEVSAEWALREEGCLSLPGQFADVSRPARVKVRYLDETGARKEIEADDLLAACLQHEIDHLDGVLFVDHLSPLKRNMIMRRLAKEQKAKK